MGTVAVVIPTIGRPSLVDAVRSAVRQEPPPAEVVVVFDGSDPGALPDMSADDWPSVRVVRTGGRCGPNAARMLGVRHSQAELVAFLDDDDEWLPGKLDAQLRLYRELSARHRFPLVTCPAEVVTPSGRTVEIAPAAPLTPHVALDRYLFERRKVMADGFAMGSSTLLCSRALLEEEPLDESIRLHEEWEWVLRASRRDDVVVASTRAALIRYVNQPVGRSASRPRGGWRKSLEFAELVGLTGRARGDFLLSVSAGMAIAHGERMRALRIAGLAWRTAKPGPHAWLVFILQWLFPARLLVGGVRVARFLLRPPFRRSDGRGSGAPVADRGDDPRTREKGGDDAAAGRAAVASAGFPARDHTSTATDDRPSP